MKSLSKKSVFLLSIGLVTVVAFQNCSQMAANSGGAVLTLSDSDNSVISAAPAALASTALKEEIADEAQVDASKPVGTLSLSSMSLKSVSGDEIVLNLQAAQRKDKLPSWLTISNQGVSLGKICIDTWTASLVSKVANYLSKAQLCETQGSKFNLCEEALSNSQLSLTDSSGARIDLSDRSSAICAKSVDFCDPKHKVFTLMAVRYVKYLDDAIRNDRIPANLRCSESAD